VRKRIQIWKIMFYWSVALHFVVCGLQKMLGSFIHHKYITITLQLVGCGVLEYLLHQWLV
jgi:hypothetical protein